MYRIMLCKAKRSNYESMYQFMTTTTDGVTSPLEFDSKEALDAKIEKMLNEDDYSKNDFIIVKVVDYSVDAKDYTDDEPAEEAPEASDDTQTE